ncbi:GspE/PulE family protein [Phycisphaerales bacterium AB-hyl4]|uniref:GspE/PulE family protein n=1 Tax=Natronomicrosphaera hydrolytica TaxID=3242702 RepID=A0ABV4TZW2_9BACT
MDLSFLSTSTGSDRGAIIPPHAIRVGDLLLEKGVIKQDQLDKALAAQRERGHKRLLGETLVEMKIVSEEQVMEVLAEAYGIPFARIHPRIADPAVVDQLPRDFLEKQGVLPLFLVRDVLTVAVHEPANVFVIEEIERLTGHRVQLVAATAKDIQHTLHLFLPQENVFVIDQLVEDVQEDAMSLVEKEVTDLNDAQNAANESPVIKLVNYLIYQAVHEEASDIHIEPGDQTLRVRYRVDGRLFEKMTPPHQMLPAMVSRIKIMAGLDISERRLPQDGGICVMIDKRQIDLRVSTMPGRFGEKVVIRIIDTQNAMVRLERLGFPEDTLERYRRAVHQPNGIILVTGPTGSGKSTTLYATLNEINSDDINISTVEDPVEYSLDGVNQFQVNEKAGFTFAGALRSLLRQDPDVVMLGEIRDQETARIATQAALTGHLVLSTLHTNDAPSAVTRLFNVGVEPYLVAASIRAVIAQRLVRKICPDCKEAVTPDSHVAHSLDRLAEQGVEIKTLYQGQGCPKCRQTGYRGRVGVYELLVPDDNLLDAISRGVSLQELRQMATDAGAYHTLRDDGIAKVRAGVTTLEELFTATTV